jgi:hypothetical protein
MDSNQNITINSNLNQQKPNKSKKITKTREEKLDYRIKMLNYYDLYGLEATLACAKINNNKLSRATLFRWKKTRDIIKSEGELTYLKLKPITTKPNNNRRSKILPIFIEFVRLYRKNRYRVGKEKLASIIKQACTLLEYSVEILAEYKINLFGLEPISSSTIGRILNSLKRQRCIPRDAKEYNKYKEVYLHGGTGMIKIRARIDKSKLYGKKKLRRSDYKPDSIGDLIQLDAITVQYKGRKHYFISGIDIVSRIAYNKSYTSLSSSSTKDFFTCFEKRLSTTIGREITIKRVQNDNGQENHKHFTKLLSDKQVLQFWNYPRSPKMNCFVEKYNHTVQAECIEWNLYLLSQQRLEEFNNKLEEWTNWYNVQRPHRSLQNLSPLQYYKQQLINSSQSQM